MSTARDAFNHAKYVLKGRFKLGEKAISKEPAHASLYARHILKGRFEPCENQ